MQRCPTRNDMNLCFTLILFFQTSELYAKHCETNDMFVFSGLLWLWIAEGFNMSYGNLLIEALQLFKHKSLFNSWTSRLCYSIIELWGFIMFYMFSALMKVQKWEASNQRCSWCQNFHPHLQQAIWPYHIGWATPLKNLSSSVGMMTFPYGNIKNVPNHQPDDISIKIYKICSRMHPAIWPSLCNHFFSHAKCPLRALSFLSLVVSAEPPPRRTCLICPSCPLLSPPSR